MKITGVQARFLQKVLLLRQGIVASKLTDSLYSNHEKTEAKLEDKHIKDLLQELRKDFPII